MKHKIQEWTPEELEKIWPGSYHLFAWFEYAAYNAKTQAGYPFVWLHINERTISTLKC